MSAPTVFDPTRPTNPVAPAAAYLGVSERHLRRALDGELAFLAIRIGSRVLVRTDALVAYVRGDSAPEAR